MLASICIHHKSCRQHVQQALGVNKHRESIAHNGHQAHLTLTTISSSHSDRWVPVSHHYHSSSGHGCLLALRTANELHAFLRCAMQLTFIMLSHTLHHPGRQCGGETGYSCSANVILCSATVLSTSSSRERALILASPWTPDSLVP